MLTRPGRYKPVADNLQIKEVVVGEGERHRRYVLCLNPEEAERQRRHREQVLVELAAELNCLREREEDHPKAACTLLTSRRYGRYLSADYLGRPRLDAVKESVTNGAQPLESAQNSSNVENGRLRALSRCCQPPYLWIDMNAPCAAL